MPPPLAEHGAAGPGVVGAATPGAAGASAAALEPGGGATWRRLRDEACERLARAGASTPRIDARRIVESAVGVAPSEFHDALREPATAAAASRFSAMVDRRCAGEPLQYVVGSWGFRSLDLLVDRRVLIPRPETEAVAGCVVSEVFRRTAGEVLVVDLGTGSGAIALSVAAECPQARVHATEVSAGAMAVARANLAGLGRAATRVRLHAGDWFAALPESLRGSVDVLASNPPYVGLHEELPPEVADWEPRRALRAGPDGVEHIERIIAEAPQWLRPDGAVVVEMAPHQSARVLRRAGRAGFKARVERDLAGRERVLVGRLR